MKDRYNKPKKFRLFSFLYVSWFAFLLFSTVEFVQAQYIEPEDTFTPVQITESALNTVQSERFNVLQQNEVLEQPVFVELPDELHQVLALRLHVDPREESILTSMPGGVEVIAKRTDLNVLNDGSYTWSGDLYAVGNYSGDIVLSVSPEGEISGTIDLEGVFWQIHPLDQHVQMLAKINEDTLAQRYRERRNQHPDHGSASLSSPSPIQGIDAGLLNTRCTPEIIRLLVLYTPAAAQGRNISSIVNLAVQETNEAYSNSQISNRRVAVSHIQQLNFNEGDDLEVDVNKLIANQTAQNLRNQHDADIVILLTDGNQGDYLYFGGIVEDIYPGNNNAYAIVQADYATGPSYTFAHEIGHIQGAQHHPDDPVKPNPPFVNAYGHRFSYKPSIFLQRRYRSTIMAYDCRPFDQDPSCERPYTAVKHFSNPNVSYRGTATGTTSQNNVSALLSTFADIADYRAPNELRASIQATGNPWTGDYTFSAQPCGGNGSYSYAWYLSQDFNNFPSTPTNTQASWNTTLSGNTGTQWYVRLDLTDTQNQEAEAHHLVLLLTDCDPGTICLPLGSIAALGQDNDGETKLSDGRMEKAAVGDITATGDGENELSVIPNRVTVGPNPFNPHTTVSVTLELSANIRVEVYDILGRRVAQLAEGNFEAGMHQFQFNANHLAGGTYLIHMQAQPDGGTTVGTYTQLVSLIKRQ